MMVIYIFFTVILMLNVLIDNIAFRICSQMVVDDTYQLLMIHTFLSYLALINGGFNHGEGNWRYVCLENRLRYVETAEEMSYHIPSNLFCMYLSTRRRLLSGPCIRVFLVCLSVGFR